MRVIEITKFSSNEFYNKVFDDLKSRQQQLFLKIIEGQSSIELLHLTKQMDLVQDSDGGDLQIMMRQVNLNFFITQIERLLPSEKKLLTDLKTIEKKHEIIWQVGRFTFKTNRQPVIYGILNVTPDSFYDGGRFNDETRMKEQIDALVKEGVDVIEVGGQTTRPGFSEITPAEELKRILPAIDYIQQQYTDTAIAVDTYKYEVMEQMVNHGVDIINDVEAFTDDTRKLTLLHNTNTGLLTMHSAREVDYDDLTSEMKTFFETNLKKLQAAGISLNRIALDQGIGYAKIADGYQDYAMMRNIDQFNYLKRPMMVAISRKGFGAKLFGLKKDDRLDVTLIAEAYMYLHGGRILRVHDVKETKQLVKMLEVIQQGFWLGK
ncbi:dihydropteroate synthase [Paucilactobacillus sp. N302-9]